jgi:tetratricopeptide (TPR) repeat protein
MNNILPILFVRYAPGAAGNYLISLLQSSNMIDCWNQTVEQSKGTKNFKEIYQNWFSDSFQSDLENHLKFEPHHPYKLDFISAKYPRGDSLSKDEFVEELQKRNDELALSHYLQAVKLNPTFVDAHYNLAMVYARKRDFSKAVEAMEIAKKNAPKDQDIAQMLNRLKADLKKKK